MPSPSAVRVWCVYGLAVLALCVARDARGQLNEHCTVSVLNRTVRVNPDGSWVLPNVPANFGQVRARATCVRTGQTVSGESALFTVPPNGLVNLEPIVFGPSTPIPVALTLGAATHTLTQPDATVQLMVSAHYADGTSRDVTAASTGTQYTISNAAIATLTGDGLVQAAPGAVSGTVVIQATHEGASGVTSVQVLMEGAAHGGIPDAWALANGLNPNDPVMPFDDPDRDGLTNLEEFQRGTDPRNPDTDGDGLPDGQEVALGTNPLLADTDGDGVRDGLEVQTGSDPLNAASLNLAQALNSIAVGPFAFVIQFNTILSEASRQLLVTGNLKDGTAIDLTSTARGTNYTSSDLNVCNFGAQPGRVFAGQAGTCTITVSNSGFQATATGTVRTFAPTPLSFVSIPGFANNVDVSGNFAYVAAGSTGLQVVDVSNRSSPTIVAAYDTPGNANDVKVIGTRAYVADGPAGLQILDIATPMIPQSLGSLDTPGVAFDVAVSGNLALVADGASGLQVIDITNPTAPTLARSVDTPGTAKGVDVDGPFAIVADGAFGIHVLDLANGRIVGSVDTPGDARDLMVRGAVAYVADFGGSLQIVDLTTPTSPAIVGATPQSLGGILVDVAQSGNFIFGADTFFGNFVSITDVSTPTAPTVRVRLSFRNFRESDRGTGIAVDSNHVYLTASQGVTENGSTGDTRLYIGQYLALEDTAGIPPTVGITAPAVGDTVIEGSTVPVTVEATDDIQVVSVDFLVDGQVVFTDSTAPYQFSVSVPTGVSSLTLSARAIDLGGNAGLADDLRVDVIPDPLTTVVGRVVNSNGVPLSGATVTTVGGQSATTGADGIFSILSVPTVLGQISVTARTIVDGMILSGNSASVPAVRGGVTEVGTIVVRGDEVFLPAFGVLAKFEFNGDLTDSSGSGRDAVLLGGNFVSTVFGQGLHVSPGGPTGIDWSTFANLLVHPYTVEVVLTPQQTDCWRKIFSFSDTSDNGWYYCNQGIQAFPNPVVGAGQVRSGERHYIAFVSTSASTVDVYFEGVRLGSTNASFTAPPPQAIFFRDDTATGRREQLDAVVEALRISGVARTAQEIAEVQQRLSTRPSP